MGCVGIIGAVGAVLFVSVYLIAGVVHDHPGAMAVAILFLPFGAVWLPFTIKKGWWE